MISSPSSTPSFSPSSSVVGHSLGGAAATVFYQEHLQHRIPQIVAFGTSNVNNVGRQCVDCTGCQALTQVYIEGRGLKFVHHPDQFDFWHSTTHVYAHRKDQDTGWGAALTIKCRMGVIDGKGEEALYASRARIRNAAVVPGTQVVTFGAPATRHGVYNAPGIGNVPASCTVPGIRYVEEKRSEEACMPALCMLYAVLRAVRSAVCDSCVFSTRRPHTPLFLSHFLSPFPPSVTRTSKTQLPPTGLTGSSGTSTTTWQLRSRWSNQRPATIVCSCVVLSPR